MVLVQANPFYFKKQTLQIITKLIDFTLLLSISAHPQPNSCLCCDSDSTRSLRYRYKYSDTRSGRTASRRYSIASFVVGQTKAKTKYTN